jgi:hypothetical protein
LCSGCCSHIAVVLLFKAPWHSPPRHGCDSHRFGMSSLAIFSLPYTVPTVTRQVLRPPVSLRYQWRHQQRRNRPFHWMGRAAAHQGRRQRAVQVRVRAHALVLLHVRACVRAWLRACACVWVRACVRTYACVRTCVPTCVCLRVRMCVLCAHMLACPSRACARP